MRHKGMTLLEVILSISLLAVVILSFLGIFIVHTMLDEKLAAQNAVYDAAKDIKSFVKLTQYDTIFNLAKNNEYLTATEVEHDDLLTREFAKYQPNNDKNYRVVVKFEADNDSWSQTADDQDCAFPLQCKIFHLKRTAPGADLKKLLAQSDAEMSLSLVKLR